MTRNQLTMRGVLKRGRSIQSDLLVPFLDPEGGSPLVVVISSLKMPKAFLILSAAQRNFAYTFVLTFATYLLSQILKLISNY